MSQQINLLAPRALEDRYLVHIGLALGLALLAVAGWWGVLRYETYQAQAQVHRQSQEIASLQAQMARIYQANPAAVPLQAEIAALTTEVAAYADLLGQVRQAGLGRPDGYSGVLEQIALVPHPESWLTQIDLRQTGSPMTLAGLGLSHEAVARYAAEVNRQFAPHGIQLQSLELNRPGTEPGPVRFKVH